MKFLFLSMILSSSGVGTETSQQAILLDSRQGCLDAVEAFTGVRPNDNVKYPSSSKEDGAHTFVAKCVPIDRS
jgi:hypothetical protein